MLRRCNHTEKRPQRVLEQDLFQLKLCWIVGKKRVEPKKLYDCSSKVAWLVLLPQGVN